jgi:hypothetical protein
LEELKAELAGEGPSPLERIVAGRVTPCWLDALVAEAEAAPGDRQHDAGAGHYWQRRAERAQRTVLRAAKTLAMVRGLGVPAVQINVAEHQVNLVGGKRTVADHAAEGHGRQRVSGVHGLAALLDPG